MKDGCRLLALSLLLMLMSACNLPTDQSSRANLAGTITAQALTLEARARTAAPPTEFPTATDESGTLTSVPVPTAYLPAATDPPQPTKTPKPTKTPEPTSTQPVLPAGGGPNEPTALGMERLHCTRATLNGQPGWIVQMRARWSDNSSDEDYFLLYSSTALHPEKVLVSAPPPNTTTYTFQRSYLESSLLDEDRDDFYIAAYNASGTSPLDHFNTIFRCRGEF